MHRTTRSCLDSTRPNNQPVHTGSALGAGGRRHRAERFLAGPDGLIPHPQLHCRLRLHANGHICARAEGPGEAPGAGGEDGGEGAELAAAEVAHRWLQRSAARLQRIYSDLFLKT